MEKGQIPFPEIGIKVFDMVKGLGQIALEFITKRFTHQGLSNHIPQEPELTQVQKDANSWVERMGHGSD